MFNIFGTSLLLVFTKDFVRSYYRSDAEIRPKFSVSTEYSNKIQYNGNSEEIHIFSRNIELKI